MTNKYFVYAFVAFFSLLAGFFVYFPLTDTDIWWHLAAGREIVHQKHLLFTDPFSYTPTNQPWVNVHWLFQILAYGIYVVFGYYGLVIAKCTCIAGLCAGISFIYKEAIYRIIACVTFSVLIYASRYLIDIRPVIITLACIISYIWIFENYLLHRKKNIFFLLIPVQILWTNSQGLFSLGPAIALCYCCGIFIQNLMRKNGFFLQSKTPFEKKLPAEILFAVLLGFCSCIITPYGLKGILFPLRLFGRIQPAESNIFSQIITENIPLFRLTGDDRAYLIAVIIVTTILIVSFAFSLRRIFIPHVLLSLSFLYLACIAHRNVVLYFIVISPIIACNLSQISFVVFLKQEKSEFKRALYLLCLQAGSVMVIVICIFFMTTHINTIRLYPSHSAISPFRVPVHAVEFLQAHPVKGNIFHSDRYGGYILWTLYPQKKVYIDGRFILRSAEFLKNYLSVLEHPEQFPKIAAQYDITSALLPSSVFYHSMKLIRWLYHSGDWDLVYADGESVLFINKNLNNYGKLNLYNPEDILKVNDLIRNYWTDDVFIQNEAIGYLHYLIRNINNQL